MARPKLKIDLDELEHLARIGLGDGEISRILGISADTLRRRKKDCIEILAAIDRGRRSGIAAIANAVYKKALKGNLRAQITYLRGVGWFARSHYTMDRYPLAESFPLSALGEIREKLYHPRYRQPDYFYDDPEHELSWTDYAGLEDEADVDAASVEITSGTSPQAAEATEDLATEATSGANTHAGKTKETGAAATVTPGASPRTGEPGPEGEASAIEENEDPPENDDQETAEPATDKPEIAELEIDKLESDEIDIDEPEIEDIEIDELEIEEPESDEPEIDDLEIEEPDIEEIEITVADEPRKKAPPAAKPPGETRWWEKHPDRLASGDGRPVKNHQRDSPETDPPEGIIATIF